jgi:hypothetical protein
VNGWKVREAKELLDEPGLVHRRPWIIRDGVVAVRLG